MSNVLKLFRLNHDSVDMSLLDEETLNNVKRLDDDTLRMMFEEIVACVGEDGVL